MMKGSRASKLINKVIPFQNKETGNQVENQLMTTDYQLFESLEKHEIRAELMVAQQEIAQEHIEKGKRAAQLIIANEELVIQNEANEKMANDLFIAQNDLVNAQITIQAHVNGLEEIMFMTSHKVRQPIANILGIASILDQFLKAPETIKKMVGYIKESTLSLDGFTKELSILVNKLKKRK